MSTISAAVTSDHRELEEYYNEVVNNPDNHDHQQRYGNRFVWALARHSVGEEHIVYPALEKFLGAKGVEMAESDRKEHHTIKLMLKEFQQLKAADPRYVPQLNKLWGTLSAHFKEEEERDLPALEHSLESKAGESERMAKSLSHTKTFVPTRSHPSAGEHLPFETAMGLLTAPFDRIADLFRKFPVEEESGASGAAKDPHDKKPTL